MKKTNKIKPYSLSPNSSMMPYHQIVGRNDEINAVLRYLQGRSVSVEEIRRMGKTLFVQKLAYLCNENLLSDEFKNDNFKAKYFTFQGQKNLAKLIEYLIKELEKLKEWHQIDLSKTYNSVAKILKIPKFNVFGIDISLDLPEYQKHWKDIFNNLLDDISESLDKNNIKLILIFDELPIMLWDWYKQKNHEEAIEFLDILRERRQKLERKGLRFIFCGSIGMNIILDTFRTEFSYTGEPTNDMKQFNLGAFSTEEVTFLCECYTLYGFSVKDKPKAWQAINKLTNGIPFYIAKIFSIIEEDFNKEITVKNIKSAYNQIINNTNNHKAFNQLVERINIYYLNPKEKADTMIALLDFLSNHKGFITEEEILKSIDLDNGLLKKHLYTLLSDHYLLRNIKKEKRHYKFKYEIFRQWWKINIA